MRRQALIQPREVWVGVALLVVLASLAAAANIPVAMALIRPRTERWKLPRQPHPSMRTPAKWPSSTPHEVPWPPPDGWTEQRAFGLRTYLVHAGAANNSSAFNSSAFQMEVEHIGWPLPVLEKKQMWWNWNNPALKGPDGDPPMSLKMNGLLLNPIIVAGGAWCVLFMPYALITLGRRCVRLRNNRCLNCAYPRGESSVCTECGSSWSPRAEADADHSRPLNSASSFSLLSSRLSRRKVNDLPS